VEVRFQRVTQPAPAPPPTTAPAAGGSAPQQPAGRPLGSTRGAGRYEGSTVDLLSLRRVSADFLVAEVKVSNHGRKTIDMDFIFKDVVGNLGIPDLEYGYRSGEFFWMLLRDASNTRYFVVNSEGRPGVCVCTTMAGVPPPTLEPNETDELFALLPAPPPGVRTVDALFAGFPEPIRNVPIG
jgi:hypothetical protein